MHSGIVFQCAALESVFSEWTSTRGYADRVANISGTGSGARENGDNFLQPGLTVFNDGSIDQLFGDSKGQLNWLVYSCYEDVANRIKAGEALTDTR